MVHVLFCQARVQTRNQFGFSKPDQVFNFATKGAGKKIIIHNINISMIETLKLYQIQFDRSESQSKPGFSFSVPFHQPSTSSSRPLLPSSSLLLPAFLVLLLQVASNLL